MTDIPDKVIQQYELVVGLEVHAQLSTQSKIFSSDAAGFGANPNEQVSPVSLGLPGTLPVLNASVVEYAIKMGLATKCRVNLENRFDRKNYFYADLPKGYQITQDVMPICFNGHIYIRLKEGTSTKIRINRIHMEEDAGKSMHDRDEFNSLIDLNRAGVPLIEIVSEPDIRSAEEAALYFTELRKILKYLDICDGNMEEGSLRCDANISVRIKGEKEYGNRCEVKNLNSVRNLQRAIEFEFKRQVTLLQSGQTILQNTLNFDAATGVTSPLRSKEMANDYRYFPEPDLPPVILSQAYLDKILADLPELPEEKIDRYTKTLGLSVYQASIISSEKEIAGYFEAAADFTSNFKALANWVIGPVKSYLNDSGIPFSSFCIKPENLSALLKLIDDKKVSHTASVRQILPAMILSPEKTPHKLAIELNLFAERDDDQLDGLVNEVLDQYAAKVTEYHNGKKGVLGLFMGEVMKRSGGKADPHALNKILIKKLEKVS